MCRPGWAAASCTTAAAAVVGDGVRLADEAGVAAWATASAVAFAVGLGALWWWGVALAVALGSVVCVGEADGELGCSRQAGGCSVWP
ncbi:hypothetical protein ACFWIJ_24765 [Streptomyces sp. NPDC127079]|uniref:hypothetical protein n=1 Tax=Streptomyces sp. NPDC127079 TaxID=3347132 RepID=UPI00365B97E7